MKDKIGEIVLWVVVIALIVLMFVAVFMPDDLDGAMGDGAAEAVGNLTEFLSGRGTWGTVRLVLTLGVAWFVFWKKFER